MTAPSPPPGPALAGLGSRLRALREAAGFSGVQLAGALGPGWRQSKVSKIETGRQLPTVTDVETWAALTGGDQAQLTALRDKASAAGEADELGALASSCRFIGAYQAVVVPLHLQTPSYMRELMTPLTEDGERLIAARMRRQAILYEPGRELVHIVGEAALRTRYGGITTATMRAQLAHLAELASLPRHTFGVIPFSVNVPVPVAEFVLYDRDLVVVESITGVAHVAEPDAVARYSRWFDQLLEAALTGAAAAEFCRVVAGD